MMDSNSQMYSECYKNALVLFLLFTRSRRREKAAIHLHRNVNHKRSRGTVEARRRTLSCMLVKTEEGSVNIVTWSIGSDSHTVLEINPFKDEAQNALFKDPVRTAQ